MRKIPGVTIAALCGLLTIPVAAKAASPSLVDARQKPLLQVQKLLQIPDSIATVTDAELHGRKGVPQFILIQDVHRHPEAQHHIADVIVQAHADWKIRSVLIEGAFGAVKPSQDMSTPLQALLLQDRVRDGSISGAELAAAVIRGDGDKRFSVMGIENPELYRANLMAYQEVQRVQAEALDELQTLEMVPGTLNLPVNSLRELERLIRLKLTPSQFERSLNSSAENIGSPTILQAVQMAKTYYRMADMRSTIFTEKLLAQPAASCSVAVVGGFHTAAMAEALRKAGKTFVVLAPRINEAGFEHLYNDRMAQTLNILKIN